MKMTKYFWRGLGDDVGALSLVMGTQMACVGLVIPNELGMNPNSGWVAITSLSLFVLTIYVIGFLVEKKKL